VPPIDGAASILGFLPPRRTGRISAENHHDGKSKTDSSVGKAMIFQTISRRIARVAGLCILLVAGALAVPPGMPRAGAETADLTIPGFWDPKRRVELPPAGAVQAIRFVTTDDFPPFNFLNAAGHLAGFNVDLTRAICAELDIRCTIQAREWDDLLPSLREGNADAVIAGIAITADARQELDFSDVYMRWPGRFVVRKDAGPLETTPEGLRGKTLAVVARTAHEAYLAAFFPEVGRKLYPTPEAAREALKSGAADAHFGDGMQLSFWLQSEAAGDCCTFAGGPYLESRFFGEGAAIAVPHGANDLRQAIDAALAALHEKGVFAEFYLRYFPVGFF
jgi:polar amino acid transport system substrate-binding protein